MLTLLKYLGIALAGASTVWGMLHKITVETPRGRQKLTRPGWIAITLATIGIAVGFASEALQHRAERNATDARMREIARVVMSAQRLTSLRVKLTLQIPGQSFDYLARTARESIDETYDGDDTLRPESEQFKRWFEAQIRRHKALYPFLDALATGSWDKQVRARKAPVACLLNLTGDDSVVLIWGRSATKSRGLVEVPILIRDPDDENPGIPDAIGITLEGSNVALDMQLSQAVLRDSLVKNAPDIEPLAGFASVVRVRCLEREPYGVFESGVPVADEERQRKHVAAMSGEMILIPNGNSSAGLRFVLADAVRVEGYNSLPEHEEELAYRGTALEFVLQP